MEIKNLEIILALDSEKHFNRAAEKLNISQPALSMKLKSLENEIGVKLVKRKEINITFFEIPENNLKIQLRD